MRTRNLLKPLGIFAILLALSGFYSGTVSAHCDGLDGPVVKAAQKALETENVNLVLIWVQKEDEALIKDAFHNTLQVRKLSSQAKEHADMYFFETLVRVHRAGEGAPYTGLKPAGRDLGPAIPAGDRALETGSVEQLAELLTHAVEQGITEHFKHAMVKKNFKSDDVAAGREFVKAYVEFIHYVEQIFESTKKPSHGHFEEAESGEMHSEHH